MQKLEKGRPLNERLKNAFVYITRLFLENYRTVMCNYKESVGKRGTKLAVFYIKYSQVIESQGYPTGSKPQENALF